MLAKKKRIKLKVFAVLSQTFLVWYNYEAAGNLFIGPDTLANFLTELTLP